MANETNPAGAFPGSDHPSYHGRFEHDGDYLWWAKTPGFHPLKAVAVLAGFAIFPPLGLAALGYFIWNNRRQSWGGRPAYAMDGGQMRGGRTCGRGQMNRTGNVAFDEHRAGVLNKLEAERQAFAEHRAGQRRKQDQDAFDAFQAKRASEGETAPEKKV